jgi:hypothetical protein
MLLRPDDAALFYRAWGALLTWVNDQRSIVPRFPRPLPDHPIDPSLAIQIRNVVWAEDALREQFLAEGAADLGGEERALIASWRERVSGSFTLLRHLQKHSIFLSDGAAYGVVGIFTPLVVMFPRVPMFVDAVLIPFRDVIITDGLLQSPPMQLSFGPGARRMFENEYRTARTTVGLRTRLPWDAGPAQARMATASPKAARRPRARRPGRG